MRRKSLCALATHLFAFLIFCYTGFVEEMITPEITSEVKKTSKGKIFKSFLLFFLGFFFGAGLTFTGFTFLNKPGTVPNLKTSPEPSPVSSPSTTLNELKWVKTDLLGGGLVFEYPQGWHVASHRPEFQLISHEGISEYSAREVLIGIEPIEIDTTHGSLGDIKIYAHNGLANPEEEFVKLYEQEKQNLSDIKEEEISSEYFKKIYHLEGKLTQSEMFKDKKVEKYFLMSDNSQYVNLEDKANLEIIVVERGFFRAEVSSEILRKVVMSFKECGFEHCQNIFK